MGLITNLVQMKAQRDLQAKDTAISGFKSVLTNPNASPEMRQWAQQGILDVTVPAIAGDGKGGGKKQHEGVRHILGSVLSQIGSGFNQALNPMAGPSKGVKQQIAQAQNRPRPAKMELTQEEQDQVRERQERALAKIRLQETEAVDAAREVARKTAAKQERDRQIQKLDALDAEEAERQKAGLPPLFPEAQRKALRLQVEGLNVPYQELVPPKDRTTERMIFTGPKGEQLVLFRSPETGKLVNLAGREVQPPEGYKLQQGTGGPEGDESGAELKERTSAHQILDDPKSTPQQKSAARETLKHLDAVTAGATTRVVIENQNAQDKRDQNNSAGDIASGIKDGTLPPDLTGLGRGAARIKIESDLAKQGFNLAKAQQDWNASKRYIATLNGQQQIRMRESATTAQQMLPKLQSLYDEWRHSGLPSGFKAFNKGALQAAKNLPGKAGATAQALESQINDMVSDLGNLYMGGNSPTDHALALAKTNLSADWNPETFKAALDLIKTNIGYRLNSIQNAGVGGMSPDSPYMPPGGQGVQPPAGADGGRGGRGGGRAGSGGASTPTPKAEDYLKKWGITSGGGGR